MLEVETVCCFVLSIEMRQLFVLVKVLHGRENAGPLPRSFAISNQFYSKTQLLCCILGHLSAVYCLLFDRTGKYVITVSTLYLLRFHIDQICCVRYF